MGTYSAKTVMYFASNPCGCYSHLPLNLTRGFEYKMEAIIRKVLKLIHKLPHFFLQDRARLE